MKRIVHLTVHKEETRHRVPRERCVRAAAHLARNVLHDVLPQERLDVLGHVFACEFVTKTFQRISRETLPPLSR